MSNWMNLSNAPPNFFSVDQKVRITKNGRTGTVTNVNHNNWFPYEVLVDSSYPSAKDSYRATFSADELELVTGAAPPAAPRCTCGATKIGWPGHSDYCDSLAFPRAPYDNTKPRLF